MEDQIRIHKLIKHDAQFKKFLTTPAKLKYPRAGQTPWRLFVQRTRGGPWAHKSYPSYPEAYNALRKYLPTCHDAAINCKPQGFEPPMVRQNYKVRLRSANSAAKPKFVVKTRQLYIPMPFGHNWCPFCRRPTVFKRMKSHALYKSIHMEDNPSRCTLCGARREFIQSCFLSFPFDTTLTWPI